MINIKNVLLEDRSNQTAKKGCLMAMISKESVAPILKFNKQLINEEDLYIEENEYGRETKPHITIRYGFLKDLNELDIRQLLKGHKKFMVEIYGLNKFDTHPKYDVAMFKVSSPVLKQLNELSGIYLNESNYIEYFPHITLSYLKKGTFPYVKEGFSIKIPIKTICYSPICGGKSYFELD
jgi:2'-5' RNA ligase